jgi:hypothetical protein
LVIGTGGSTPGVPDAGFADELIAYYYTVKELLTGVYPNASRTYTVTSGRFTAEELPATIPQGAFILTRATPRTSEGNTLTVNGWLTTEGTLNDITQITLGNGGFLDLAEPTGNFLTGLTNLKVGPGAIFTVSASNGVLLESLDTLFLGDGSAIDISQAGTTVTFNDDTPIDLTVGKNVFYSIGMSPSAVVDTVISRDGSLVGASTLIVYPGSSFTVADGATFTVDGTSTFDISRQPIPPTGDTSPIVINGTLEVTETATFIGPDFATVQADPAALYETINLGPNGKVVLNDGATFTLGNSALAPNLVGAANAPYTWTGNDGAQIEINSGGIIIRDTDSTLDAAITVAGPGAGILKGQSLTLERGVTLDIDTGFALYLFGGTDVDGAKLLGPGTLEVGTIEFTGNDYGWQAIGDNIAIADDGIGGQYLAAYPAVTPATSPIAATLKAADNRGGAIISIPASVTLEIRGGVTVDLNGSMARKNGEIRLASGAIISLVNSTSVILTGAGPASHTAGVPLSTASAVTTALDSVNVVGLTGANASGVSETLASTTAVADVPHTSLPRGKLVSLTGGDDTIPLPGTVTATAVVNINSELDTEATP